MRSAATAPATFESAFSANFVPSSVASITAAILASTSDVSSRSKAPAVLASSFLPLHSALHSAGLPLHSALHSAGFPSHFLPLHSAGLPSHFLPLHSAASFDAQAVSPCADEPGSTMASALTAGSFFGGMESSVCLGSAPPLSVTSSSDVAPSGRLWACFFSQSSMLVRISAASASAVLASASSVIMGSFLGTSAGSSALRSFVCVIGLSSPAPAVVSPLFGTIVPSRVSGSGCLADSGTGLLCSAPGIVSGS